MVKGSSLGNPSSSLEDSEDKLTRFPRRTFLLSPQIFSYFLFDSESRFLHGVEKQQDYLRRPSQPCVWPPPCIQCFTHYPTPSSPPPPAPSPVT